MTVEMEDLATFSNNENFTVNSNLNRPALVVFVGLEMIVALCANMFVLLFTICHPKVLKHPANIFLTNFVLGSLLATALYMPSMIVTAAAGEWVFGTTLEEKVGTCQFFGFVFSFTIYLSTFSLTLISFDRFLFIVKPLLHRRLMKTSVAVAISIFLWIMSLILSCTPLMVVSLGEYAFGEYIVTCRARWVDNLDYLILNFLVMITCALIIIITSIWTYCFTQKYIKKITVHQSTTNNNNVNHVYRVRVCKIVSLFGTMLFVTAVSYGFGIGAAFIGVVVGTDNIPGLVYTSMLILILLNNVLNPIVQSYFRKELYEFIVKHFTHFTDFIKQTIIVCIKRKDDSVSNTVLDPSGLNQHQYMAYEDGAVYDV